MGKIGSRVRLGWNMEEGRVGVEEEKRKKTRGRREKDGVRVRVRVSIGLNHGRIKTDVNKHIISHSIL